MTYSLFSSPTTTIGAQWVTTPFRPLTINRWWWAILNVARFSNFIQTIANSSIGFLNNLMSYSPLCSISTTCGAWWITTPFRPLTINWGWGTTLNVARHGTFIQAFTNSSIRFTDYLVPLPFLSSLSTTFGTWWIIRPVWPLTIDWKC